MTRKRKKNIRTLHFPCRHMHTFFLWFKMREYLQQCLHEIDMHSKFPAKSALFFFSYM